MNIAISARRKSPQQSIESFLNDSFSSIPLDHINSIFGFSDKCKLYGGRDFIGSELTDADLNWMYSNNINYRIPLTSFFGDKQLYEEAKPFLEKHHRKGNSVILVKDSLAEKIRKDFPLYTLECSVIKEVNTKSKLESALNLYDTVVPLPLAFNTNYELLDSFDQEIKNRIRLFLNVGCAYKCPNRICYGSFSKMNRGDPGAKFECSQLNEKKYIYEGMTDFNIESYTKIGYTKFKLLRFNPNIAKSTAY